MAGGRKRTIRNGGEGRGRTKRARVVARPSPGQKRSEQLLRLEHAITLRLSEAEGIPDAGRAVLRAICESERWDVGEFWLASKAGDALARSASWVERRSARAREFVARSDGVAFRRGIGLVGSVWGSGKPLWIADVMSDPRTLRRELGRETGLRAGLLFPVRYGGSVVGVLDFACRSVRQPDELLMQSLDVISTQLGQRVQRAQAEEELRRFRLAMDSSADMIVLVDRATMRFIDANSTVCRLLGYKREELLAMPLDKVLPVSRAELAAAYDRQIADPSQPAGMRSYYICKDGSHLPFESRRQVLRSGERWLISIVSRDIRERTQAEAALKESEARFRALTELSSDWYWEQDAGYRFTRIEGRFVTGGDKALQRDLIGKQRWHTGLYIDGGWEAHKAALDARQPFHDTIMWRPLADGTRRFVAVSGEPIFDASGRFTGYRGVGRDVTAQKRGEQLLRLEHQVARSLADAEDMASGVTSVLRAFCEAEGWACGRYFEIDEPSALLRFRTAWGKPDPSVERFIRGSRSLTYASGEGLCGKVWASGEPAWSKDTMVDARVKATGLAADTGIRGAFVFPVQAVGRIVGVVSFTSQAVREPDERLRDAALVIGRQIGQFVQRKRAEEALRESEARFRSLTQMSSDFFWETDAEHRFTQMVHGPNYVARFGSALLGKAAWDLPSRAPDEAGWATLRASFDAHEPFRDFEFARPWPDGGTRYFTVSGEPRFAADGSFLGYRGVGRETTEIALAREHVASLAYSDPLTGLANRTSLAPAFGQAVERARRRSSRLAALFIDLDGFKPVNDAYGHSAGDRILVDVARRLRANLRASDLVARIGGDEFFAVLEDVHEGATLETVAHKILAELARPYELSATEQAHISASMGISLYPQDGTDSATLMKHADMAMYAAKQAGKNAYRFYAPGKLARTTA